MFYPLVGRRVWTSLLRLVVPDKGKKMDGWMEIFVFYKCLYFSEPT